jgi:hypothetical protein
MFAEQKLSNKISDAFLLVEGCERAAGRQGGGGAGESKRREELEMMIMMMMCVFFSFRLFSVLGYKTETLSK